MSLAKLKEEFLGHKNGGSSPDVSTLSIPHMSNMASQTDLRGEVIISCRIFVNAQAFCHIA
jgi:hypothetical protein